MLSLMKNWKGTFEINGQTYDSFAQIPGNLALKGDWHIKLLPKQNNVNLTSNTNVQTVGSKEVRITVKQYMTKKASPEFDFMARWNNDEPMPLRTMTGIIEKQTPGMYYMKLHGDIWAEKIAVCMCCGKRLTNPVSQYFGIGPECGNHGYVNPFDSEEELKEAVAEYKKKLQSITWEGWVIKSAVTSMEDVE